MISFLVIAVPDDLAPDQVRQSRAIGPDHAAASARYPTLLHDAGFGVLDTIDVTDEYEATLAAWIDAWDDDANQLSGLVGDEEFADRQTGRVQDLDAVRKGLLKRYLVSGVRS